MAPRDYTPDHQLPKPEYLQSPAGLWSKQSWSEWQWPTLVRQRGGLRKTRGRTQSCAGPLAAWPRTADTCARPDAEMVSSQKHTVEGQ